MSCFRYFGWFGLFIIMAPSFFILLLAIVTAGSSNTEDIIKDRSDAMAKSIADQNRKVEKESDELVKAIDETGKEIESKKEEEKFRKANNKVDELMKATEDAVEKKGNEAEAKQMKAEQLVEQQGKIIERVGKELGHTNIRKEKKNSVAANAGKKRIKETESKPKRRMSISYTVKLPAMKNQDDVLSTVQSGWNDEFQSYNKAPIERYKQHQISLVPFPSNDAQVDNDAMTASHYIQTVKFKRLKKKMRHRSASLGTLLKHKHRSQARLDHQRVRDDDNEDEENRDDYNDDNNENADNDDNYLPNNDNDEDGGNDVEVERNDEEDGTRKKHKAHPIGLTEGINVPLPENLKNEIEEERLLRAAQQRTHRHLKDADDYRYGNQEDSHKAEEEMEQKWNRIHSLGSPELLYHWPFLGKQMGYLKGQQLSVVSPGQVELMQTEFPDYPRIRDEQNEGISGE